MIKYLDRWEFLGLSHGVLQRTKLLTLVSWKSCGAATKFPEETLISSIIFFIAANLDSCLENRLEKLACYG